MKKIALLTALFIAVCVGGPVFAQSTHPLRPRPVRIRVSRPAPPQREGAEATVPLRLVGGLPTVEMKVNGRGPFIFAIDTGQPFSVSVTPATMDRMGLMKTGEMLIGDPSGAAPHAIATFDMDSLSLDGISFRHVGGSAAAMQRGGQTGIDGAIGMSLFEGLLPTIDYGRGVFALKPGALPPPNGRDIVEATIDEMGLIVVPLSLGDQSERVHLDTGNGRVALSMPTDRISSQPTHGDARDVGVARTVSQEVKIKEIDLAAPVRIGTTTLPIRAVSYPSIAPIGNLGSLGLTGTAVTIDMESRRVRIIRSQ